MNKQLQDLDTLISLIEERDDAYDQLTEAAIDLLQPTLLTAIVSVLNVDEALVTWITVNVDDTSVIVTCSVNLPYEVLAQQRYAPVLLDPNDVLENEQIFHLGVPLAYAVASPEDTATYINQMIEDTLSQVNVDEVATSTSTIPEPEFDTSSMSSAQIMQLLLSRQTNGDKKH